MADSMGLMGCNSLKIGMKNMQRHSVGPLGQAAKENVQEVARLVKEVDVNAFQKDGVFKD